jgi:hypothetical protein
MIRHRSLRSRAPGEFGRGARATSRATLALAAGLALGAADSAAQTDPALVPGAAAWPGRWASEGGCAARTGQSLDEPLRAPPAEAWRLDVRGAIESEPLVWDECVVLSVREASSRAGLRVIDRTSGRTLSSASFASPVPLSPALWENRIALRAAPDRIDVLRIARGRLELVRSMATQASFSAPLLFENELYARDGDELVCWDLDRREERWRLRASSAVRGRPSLRGQVLAVLAYDDQGRGTILRVERGTGRSTSIGSVGCASGPVPASADAHLALFERAIFARLPQDSDASEGVASAGVFLQLSDEPQALEPVWTALATDPTAVDDGWVALEDRAPEERRWLHFGRAADPLSAVVLASASRRTDLCATRAPARAASGIVYLHDLAARSDDHAVLWRATEAPRLRPVPAGDHLLTVCGPGRLIALRAREEPPTSAQRAARAEADRADARLARSYAALALESTRLGDLDLTRRYLTEAQRRSPLDVSEAEIAEVQDALARAPTQKSPDPRRVAALVAKERLIVDGPVRTLVEAARASDDHELRLALLRAALVREPDHAQATELVRAFVPANAPSVDGQPVPTIAWLDFLDVHARHPITITVPGADSEDAEAVALLAQESHGWRPDLVAYGSTSVLVLAPHGRPSAVACAVAIGESLSAWLAALFPGEALGEERLRLLLYESRAEYVEQSLRAESAPEEIVGWTAGHYSPALRLTRLFVPEDDATRERLARLYAHELTHHWLDVRAPFARTSGPRRNASGHWVVEGFARMVEEISSTAELGTIGSIRPGALSLDTLASAPPATLLEWPRVLGASFEDFLRFSRTNDRPVELAWRLGAIAKKSELDLYYDQGAALCHLLFQAGGRDRERLLTLLRTRYEGGALPPTNLLFGVDAVELGQRVQAFASEASR